MAMGSIEKNKIDELFMLELMTLKLPFSDDILNDNEAVEQLHEEAKKFL